MARMVPAHLTEVWKSPNKTGDDRRPVCRATIQVANVHRHAYDTAMAQGGTFERDRHRKGWFNTIIFGDDSRHHEIRNIKSCDWERSIGQDAATCTLVLQNSELTAIGNPTGNTSDTEFEKPGWFTFNRGQTTIGANRWGYDDETGWQGLFVPDRMVRTYEGYGLNRDVPPDQDPHLVQSGTWMIDKVTYDADGTITLEMRDLARLLLDAVVFPPGIPMAEYPLTWSKIKSVNVPGRDAKGGRWRDRLRDIGDARSSNDYYVGKGFTNEPFDSYVQPNGGVDGHHARHAIFRHDSNAVDSPDHDLYWSSTGQDARLNMVWWEFEANQPVPVAALRLRSTGGPYKVYVSIHNGTKWLGKKKIPWKRNGQAGTTGNVDIHADIPFVQSLVMDRYWMFDTTLPRKYNAKKIRLTFSYLREASVGEHPWRAGLREMMIYTADSLQDLYFEKGEVLKVVGNYGDYCADEETEILTRRGWLRWDDVQEGDETLAVNDQGRSEWTVIESVFRELRDRKMMSMESQVHSSLTTPDHRWLTRDHAGRAEWRTTETLKHGHSIPLTATRADHPQEAKYVDPLVETVAWFWTEGWTHAQGGCVNAYLSQSRTANPEHCDRIEAALTALAGPASVRTGRTVSWSMSERTDGVVTYRLGQDLTAAVLDAAPDKVVAPEFLTALTQAQLDLFIETSVDADGWRTSGARRISQASEARTRAFEMACALAGVATSTVERDGVWYTTVLKSRFFRPALTRREEVDYQGMIWCPTLKHHNWLARRNGKVFFTGNTHIVKWVLAWAGWYWPNHETRQDFIKNGSGGKDFYTYAQGDPALPKGRVWGDFMRAGTAGVEDLTVDMFDKKPLMDIINYVRDLLGFVFFIAEDGAAVWRMPNLWSLGNYRNPYRLQKRGLAPRTTEIVTIDERETLWAYSTTLDSTNIRERIFVGNVVGGVGTVIKGFNPYPIGLRRTAGWTDQNFKTKRETRVMADMISARSMFKYKTSQATIPGYPKIQIDDQIRIFERVTNETYYHYVLGIKSSLNMEEGEWTYDLQTHWLGERPQDAWVVDVEELDSATRQYLSALGYSARVPDDRDEPEASAEPLDPSLGLH